MPIHYTEMKSFSTTHTTTKLVSSHTGSSQVRSPTLKSSQFGPPTKMQVNLHAHTQSKWFSPRVQKPSQFRPPTQQPNQFHPYTEITSNSTPHTEYQVNLDHPHKNQVNFNAHTKNKWFSARIQVTSQFLPPAQEPSQFHPYTEIRSSSIPHTEIKSISTTTKNKFISMLTLKKGIYFFECQFCSKPANWMHTFTMVVGSTDGNTLGQKARGGQRSLSRTDSFSRA